jgi:predicted peptidase
MLHRTHFLALALLFITQVVAHAEEPPRGALVATEMQTDDAKAKLKYFLYLPSDYDDGETPWPLLLFLHGAGERGEDLNQVKVHGPPKLIDKGKEFPMIVISPQCPKGEWWNPATLSKLLDEVSAKYRVDPEQVFVTGLSMGGFGTWSLAMHSPDRFAAIVPICGGGDENRAKEIAHIPAWIFHGGKDNVIPASRSEKMEAALKAAGGTPKLTLYPDAGHDSWTEAYNTGELYDWLLAQKRAKKVDAEKPAP